MFFEGGGKLAHGFVAAYNGAEESRGHQDPVQDDVEDTRNCEMDADCGHLLCELIERPCSLATGRSRGCRPGLAAKNVAPEVFEEVRALLAAIDPDVRDERGRVAAVRLAAIIRREALEDRHLLVHARMDEPDLAPALERLCVRRR